jgi:TonB family protein
MESHHRCAAAEYNTMTRQLKLGTALGRVVAVMAGAAQRRWMRPGRQSTEPSAQAPTDMRPSRRNRRRHLRLDAELKVLAAMACRDKTRELAAAAKSAGEKAAADAVDAKQKAEVAAKARASVVAKARTAPAPLLIGGNIRPPTKVKDVTPVYPAIAKSANVLGEVVIEATIGTDGKVSDAKVVRSIPLLDRAALDAVRQWEYMPTLLNGVPVPVTPMVRVNSRGRRLCLSIPVLVPGDLIGLP